MTASRIELFRRTRLYLDSKKIDYIKPLDFGPYFRTCIQPFSAPYIALDGSVRPCCTMFGDYEETLDKKVYKVEGNRYNLGNIYKDSFSKIWFGSPLKELRNFLKETDYKEGSKIPLDQLELLRSNCFSKGRFEQCRSCSWRWSVEG